jgi:hypothetical protein
MFGTVFRARPKSGKLPDIMKLGNEQSQRGNRGWIRTYILEEASGDIWGTVLFEDERSYRANAADPAQDAWYQKFRALLEADPEWHDGSITEESPK